MNKLLRNEILKRAKADQDARFFAMKHLDNKKIVRRVYQVDQLNFPFIKKVLTQHNWPGFDLVGKKAGKMFWLLVQHTDTHPEFQKLALQKMRVAVRKNQADKKYLAYLWDRVLSNAGKKQKFGTQCIIVNKKFALKPVQSRKNLAKLRKEYNLPPEKEYLAIMTKSHKLVLKRENSQK